MMGKTHRVGGMLCCLGGYTYLESKGLLLGNVSPLLQLAVMYPFAIFGSVASDFDHNWQSCPSKDIISLGVNKVLHLTTDIRGNMKKSNPFYKLLGLFDAKHRSWQTHSEMVFLALLYPLYLVASSSVVTPDSILIRLMGTGFILGLLSHLVLDMLTPEGIWFLSLRGINRVFKLRLPEKISFVPNTSFFRTGGSWEGMVRCAMWGIILYLVFSMVLNGVGVVIAMV